MTGAACTPPIRQFDIRNQALTCAQANAYAYDALRSMRFAITGLETATPARPGAVRGWRMDGRNRQHVVVDISCTDTGVDVDAHEDHWLQLSGGLEFKRGFYFAFTGITEQDALAMAAAAAEEQRPMEAKERRGLLVTLEPIRGFAAKLELDMDLAAAGILPLRVTIKNVTPRTYAYDPDAVVLIRNDGQRVGPLRVEDAARLVRAAMRQPDAAETVPVDHAAIVEPLQARLLRGNVVAPNQTVSGYLFYPLAEYRKGRMVLEDGESEETEGFVVEF